MISRDYRKEVGLSASDEKVPWPIAAVICAVCIAGVVWFARQSSPSPDTSEREAAPASTVAKR